MSLFSLAMAAPNPTKQFARVRWAKRAISAGRQRKAAVTAVRWYFSICSSTKLINKYPFSGRRRGRDPAVKEEPKSPGESIATKRKVFSTTDARPIGQMESIDVFTQGSSKRQKLASGGLLMSDLMVCCSTSLLIPPQGQPGSLRGPPRQTQRKGLGSCLSGLGKNSRQVAKTARKFRRHSINADI